MLLRFNSVLKPISEAKSTVTGFDESMTETGAPPPCGVSAALVIVTSNEATPQMGASVPTRASCPDPGRVEVVWLMLDEPPQLRAANAAEITMDKMNRCFRINVPPKRCQGCRVQCFKC